MDIEGEISRNVAASLLQADRSKASAARALGISESAFNRKVAGKTEFYPSELIKLAEFLNVDVADFWPMRRRVAA